MKVFLYTLGALAEIGMLSVAFVMFWFYSSMDIIEILAWICLIATVVILPIFLQIEKVSDLVGKGKTNNERGESYGE